MAFCIDQSDGVTAVSESLREDTCDSLGIAREIRVIPNFLDVTRFRPIAVPRTDRSRKRLVHVSNFRPVKRIGALVEVFRRIRQQLPATLVLVGDGPEMPGARAQIAAAGLEPDIEYAGEVHDVVGLFATSDLFLLPSATESFGLAALEAMACEVPVIASRVGGLPEVIDDGISGFLHEPDDLDGMVASAVRLLTDEVLHRRMARAGRAVAVERYAADRVVPQYEAAYEELLQAETV